MKKIKVTQRQAIFYQLWKQRRIPNGAKYAYIPIFDLMGEVYVKEHFGVWAFVSYEVSARMSELCSRNPSLFESKKIVGKSGAKYYAYRLHEGVKQDDIKDPDILEFYLKIKDYNPWN